MVGKRGRKGDEEDDSESPSSSSSSARHACAACRHQRRKCKPGCVMAPYFPADRMEEFQEVHKIFGVSNVTKRLENLETEESREAAAECFKWEAKAWKKDPVNGPLGAYDKLKSELENCRRSTSRIANFQQQAASNRIINSSSNNMNELVYNMNIGAHSIINPHHHHNFSMPILPMPTNNGYNAPPPVLYSHPIFDHQRRQLSINQQLVVERSPAAMEYQTFKNNNNSYSNSNGNGNGNGGPILYQTLPVGQQLRQPPILNNLPPHQFHPPPPPQ